MQFAHGKGHLNDSTLININISHFKECQRRPDVHSHLHCHTGPVTAVSPLNSSDRRFLKEGVINARSGFPSKVSKIAK
jgi:hypothetical protein